MRVTYTYVHISPVFKPAKNVLYERKHPNFPDILKLLRF